MFGLVLINRKIPNGNKNLPDTLALQLQANKPFHGKRLTKDGLLTEYGEYILDMLI